jgi:hypothetical protein
LYYPETDTYIKLTEEELSDIGCEYPSVSCKDMYDDLKALRRKGNCSTTKVEQKFAQDMHARERRCIGCNKGTIIGATVGGCVVVIFVGYGTYKLLKEEYGCFRKS